MRGKSLLAMIISIMLLLTGFFICTVDSDAKVVEDDSLHALGASNTDPTTGWNVEEIDTPVGWSVFIWDVYGGWWSDAEKRPGDDAAGNPAPDNPGEEDDLLCWAATDANMLEYTGWGFTNGMDTPDEFLDYYENHTTDQGSTIEYGLTWWFNGDLQCPGEGWSSEDVQGGAFWPANDPTGPIHISTDKTRSLYYIESDLATNRACGIGIDEIAGDGGHAITVWGITIDPDKEVTDPARYMGVWVSDSDSHKGTLGAEDVLRYYNVTYDGTNGYWYMPHFGAGWSIVAVIGLDVFPGETRPIADIFIAENNGEGSEVILDAGFSQDPDGDMMSYRWDLDGDGTWDTEWSANPVVKHTWSDDYVGMVYMQVTDGRLTDVCSVEIEVLNIEPVIDLTADSVIDEAMDEVVVIDIVDPGIHDTFTITVDWGDGTIESFTVIEGMRVVSVWHHYPDDDPTGTPFDEYTIIVRIVDNSGGYDSERWGLTVMDLAPSVSIDWINQPDPFFILPLVHTVQFHAIYSDVGTFDTHVAVWDWGDSTHSGGAVVGSGGSGTVTGAHIWGAPGTYIVTLTVTDDDTLSSTDTWTVVVMSAEQALGQVDSYIQGLPSSAFYKYPRSVTEIKSTFHVLLTIDLHKVQQHDYIGARTFLLGNVRTMMDGQPMSMNRINIDWVSDPVEQKKLCIMVDDIARLLYNMK
jgi:hypothetical protein